MEHFNHLNELWSKALRTKTEDAQYYIYKKVKLNVIYVNDFDSYISEFVCKCNQNIFESFLQLIETSPDYMENRKISCALFIASRFGKWLIKVKSSDRQDASQHLIDTCNEETCFCSMSDDTRLKALDISTRYNLKLFLVLSEIFNFSEIVNKEAVSRIVLDRLENFGYPERGLLLGKLQLQDKYDIEKIIIPLLIQANYNDIEIYVNKNESVLLNVLNLIDKLCAPKFDLKELSKEYEKLPNRHMDKFRTKFLTKFALSLLKNLNRINLINSFENIYLQIKLSQLRYLTYLKYDPDSKGIGEVAWSELVLSLIKEDNFLRLKLLTELVNYQKDIKTATAFWDIFKLDSPELLSTSPEIAESIQNFNINDPDSREIPKKVKDAYFPDELTLDKIIFVDNTEKMEQMIENFENKKPDVIGMDSEWKPFLGVGDTEDPLLATNSQLVSIFQISTREYSFIISMDIFNGILSDELIERFFKSILNAPDTIKIGFSFRGDSNMLCSSFEKYRDQFKLFSESVINMDEAVKEFQQNWCLYQGQPTESEIKNKGLSELTRFCLGKPLDKSETMSNWDNRPLREAQIKYAALDAYVLIKIYDYIQERCKSLGIEFNYFNHKSESNLSSELK